MKIALFIPCFISSNYPEVGIATLELLELLERLGCTVDFPFEQTPAASSCSPTKVTRKTRPPPRPTSCAASRTRITITSSVHRRAAYCTYARIWTRSRKPRRSNEYGKTPTSWWSFSMTCSRCRSFRGPNFRTRCLCTTPVRRYADCESPRCPNCVRSRSPKVKGIEFVKLDRPDECCGFGGLFSVFEEGCPPRWAMTRSTTRSVPAPNTWARPI